MIELSLRSGAVVAFDGRILEIFSTDYPRGRFHVAQLGPPRLIERPGGSTEVCFDGWPQGITFAAAESPSAVRLLALLAEAHDAVSRSPRGSAQP